MLFQSILHDSTPFHNIPPRSIAFLSVKKSSIPFQSDEEHSTTAQYTLFQSISQHCTPFLNISPCSVVFHSIKERSICVETTKELYTVSHYMWFYTKSSKFHLTAQNSTSSIPFHSVKEGYIHLQKISLYCITVYPIPLHSQTFYSIPQYSSTFLSFTLSQRRHHSLPIRTGDIYYVTLQLIPLQSTTLPSVHDIPPRSIAFHSAKEHSTLFPRNQKPSIKSHYTTLHSIPQLST